MRCWHGIFILCFAVHYMTAFFLGNARSAAGRKVEGLRMRQDDIVLTAERR